MAIKSKTIVKIKNNTNGKLVYVSTLTGETHIIDEPLGEIELTIEDLKAMRAEQSVILTEKWASLEDRDVIAELGLEDIYPMELEETELSESEKQTETTKIKTDLKE